MFSWLKKDDAEENGEKNGYVTIEPDFRDSDAREILDCIKEEYGLDYRRQEAVTLRKIERFAQKHGFDSFKTLANAIKNSKSLETSLINSLTVGETYFYREIDQIKILAQKIYMNGYSRVLSAPCSSGEEVYSILLYLQTNYSIPPSLHITGIDINTEALSRAQKGCYSQRSVSQLPADIIDNHFIQKDREYCIQTALKRYTSFVYRNIFDPQFHLLGKFDAVLSRNMMIYFTDDEKRRAVSQLQSVLKPGGLLFLGHADISFVPEGFEKLHSKSTIYYRLKEYK